jgi:hypothetical protein
MERNGPIKRENMESGALNIIWSSSSTVEGPTYEEVLSGLG